MVALTAGACSSQAESTDGPSASTEDPNAGTPPASSSSSPSPPAAVPSEPALVALTDPAPADRAPQNMAATPTARDTQGLAQAGRDRISAESFAVSFAQLQTETRLTRDQDRFLAEVTSTQLDPAIYAFLQRDYEQQRTLGSQRGYDPESAGWVRSEVVGSENEPTRVNVEVAATATTALVDIAVWNRTRVDVVWEDGAWRVIDYSSGLTPEQPTDENSEIRAALTGAGWREFQ